VSGGEGISRPLSFGRRTAEAAPGAGRVTRRGLILLGLQTGLAGMLGWRLRQLQIEESAHFLLMAEENRVNMRLIAPARAQIYDRQGRALAINQQNYRAVIVREQAGDPAAVLDRLARIIEISPAQRERVLTEMARKSAFVPVVVAEHLAWEEFAQIGVNAPALPGVHPEVGLTRHYPHGPETAHVVGYVGRVTEKDLARANDRDPILQVPEFQIGKRGLERARERTLRGSAGTRRIEVNATGRVIRELARDDGTPGPDLHLTLDLALQSHLHERLGEESAAAVLIDVTNGDLLALGSTPSYDPNLFVRGISSADYKALLENERRPLHNKWASGMYPPGSTFKMVVALAGLEAGVIGPGETTFCNGGYRLGNRRFHCWRRGGHGNMAMREAIEQSCDVYFYELAKRTGIDAIAAMARRLGLGVEHDVPLPELKSGLIPSREWKPRNRDEPWLVGDTLNAGIGQGFVLATPLQLAVMAARLATGRAIAPRLIRARAGLPLPAAEAPALGLAPGALRLVQGGMHDVVNGRRGTARRSRITAEAAAMAGKTGTSQVRNITAAERAAGVTDNADLPWNRRDHALFVAFAPVHDPLYAVSVVVEHGGGGSRAAAPVARDILLRALYGPEPPLDAYPAGQRPDRPPQIPEPRPEPAVSPRIRT